MWRMSRNHGCLQCAAQSDQICRSRSLARKWSSRDARVGGLCSKAVPHCGRPFCDRHPAGCEPLSGLGPHDRHTVEPSRPLLLSQRTARRLPRFCDPRRCAMASKQFPHVAQLRVLLRLLGRWRLRTVGAIPWRRTLWSKMWFDLQTASSLKDWLPQLTLSQMTPAPCTSPQCCGGEPFA